jgi:nitrate/TMAO reductase-like tetraheme cytochrome c subunit
MGGLNSMHFSRLAVWLRPIAFLGRNGVSLTGGVLTTTSAFTMIAYWLYVILLGGGAERYPYAGIIIFLILPIIFILGLILIPIGAYLRRHHLRKRGELPAVYPEIHLADPSFRKAAELVGVATVLNVIIFSAASYKGTQYMDSAQFCGETCHTVMQPEYTAYLISPHARVACVDCHIGPGASWFVRSKVSGVRQVFAVLFHDYERPISSPVQQLRPARATCEQCHWPQRFSGDIILVRPHYKDDEANTSSKTVLVMKVGGHSAEGMVGIHGHHLDPGVQITYISTDEKRQVIPRVTYVDPKGKTTVFNSSDKEMTPEELSRGELRVMDCLDCHNRPTHTFQLPEEALDQAISQSAISADLPYIKKEGLLALKATYPNRDTARQRIADVLRAFYKKNYPQIVVSRSQALEAAISRIQSTYLDNVFPAMNVTWGTYPNNLGHTDWPGCFRCHDGSHVSADGDTIPNNCDACHELLAFDEHNPKILEELGMK